MKGEYFEHQDPRMHGKKTQDDQKVLLVPIPVDLRACTACDARDEYRVEKTSCTWLGCKQRSESASEKKRECSSVRRLGLGVLLCIIPRHLSSGQHFEKRFQFANTERSDCYKFSMYSFYSEFGQCILYCGRYGQDRSSTSQAV